MEEKRGRGYIGKSMSVNARSAYSNGEMPLSKWTKSAILEVIADEVEEKLELVKKLTAAELRRYFLRRTAWHHTGAFYSETVFYEIDFDYLEKFTAEDAEDIISRRKPRQKREKSVIEAEKAAKVARKAEKDLKAEKEQLFKYQSKYKSIGGFMRSTTIDLDELRRIRSEKIAEKREELRKVWKTQAPHRIKLLNDDKFVEQYIR